jgi:sterol desaturase/sphingolipid hydroxylase (fatty acid hydroxylase superfamily)
VRCSIDKDGSNVNVVEQRAGEDISSLASGRRHSGLRGLLFPVLWGGACLAFGGLLAIGWNPGVALVVVGFAQLAVISALETVIPYRRSWSWWDDRQCGNDLAHWLVNTALGPLITAGLSTALIAVAARARTELGATIWPEAWPLAAQFIVVVIVSDIGDWVKHWLLHHVDWLWRVHALHHNPTKMHAVKSLRFHVLEVPLRFAVRSVPLILIGAPEHLVLWYLAVVTFLGKLNHSNLDMPLPSWVHYVVSTAEVHRLHHSVELELGNSNLASITMLPDLVFGTFKHPDAHRLGECGIEPDTVPRGLWAQLLFPLRLRTGKSGGGVDGSPAATPPV